MLTLTEEAVKYEQQNQIPEEQTQVQAIRAAAMMFLTWLTEAARNRSSEHHEREQRDASGEEDEPDDDNAE